METYQYESPKDAQEILSAISTCLKECDNVDFKLLNFTFKCEAYVRHALVEFLIHVDQDQKDHQNRIEIKRIKGDRTFFCSVVRSIKAYLQSHDIITISSPSPSSSEWSAKAKIKAASILAKIKDASSYTSLTGKTIKVPITEPLQLPPLKVTTETITASVNHMLNMSKPGGYTDVRSEALRTLADMSDKKDVQDIIGNTNSTENLEILLSCVSEDDIDIHRLATTILANVCQSNESCRSYIKERNFVRLFMERLESQTTRVVIESLRLLKTLSDDMSAEEKDDFKGKVCKV